MLINQSQQATLALAENHLLAVTASAVSVGIIYRLGNTQGEQAQSATAVANETVTLGPYTQTQRFLITCAAGSLAVADSPVDLTALNITGGTVELSADYADSSSYQPIAADLNLAAGAGTSDAGDTAFLAPIMGNALGNALTKTNNYIAGTIGALSVTGSRATVLPLAGILGVLMDGNAAADGVIVAHIDGSDPSTQTNARAAFAVSVFNNNAASGVEYGVDLYYVPGSEVNTLLSGTAKSFTPTKGAIRFPNGQWLVTLATAITADSTTTTAPAGSLGITSHATGVGKLFTSDGAKWQFVAVA